jgi:hypothetical protein
MFAYTYQQLEVHIQSSASKSLVFGFDCNDFKPIVQAVKKMKQVDARNQLRKKSSKKKILT